MDDINTPLDDALFDGGPFDDGPRDSGSFDDGSTPPPAAFEDGSESPLVFDDSTALPPATPFEEAHVVGSGAPAFVDGSSFIEALDTPDDADWGMEAVAYQDSPVMIHADFADAGGPKFSSASDGFQTADLASAGFGGPPTSVPAFGGPPSDAPGFGGGGGDTPEFGAIEFGDPDASSFEFGAAPDAGPADVAIDVAYEIEAEPPAVDLIEPPAVDLGQPLVGGSEPAEEPADADAGKADRSGRAGRKASKGRAKDGLMLGVHVTPKQVYGVLIRPTAEGHEPLRQFVRNRSDSGAGFSDTNALSPDIVSDFGDTAAPDLSGDGVAITFGGGADIDFSSEFAGIGDLEGVAMDAVGAEPTAVHTQPIVFELKDILDECEKSGFGRPPLALAIGAPDVDYLEVAVPPEKQGKKKAAKKGKKADPADRDAVAPTAPVKRDRLMALLAESVPGVPHKDRIAFVPMTARDGHRRYLAVLPQAGEPVAPSLEMLRQQGRHARTSFRTLEAEVPLLMGLSRLIVPGTPGENTAVVRVGAEDTVVLLLADGQLHHYELMQSVTAFDGPDTICSRVLLQQDVQGVGTVHNVVILADELERELVQGFSAFYPESHVETLRDGLARHGLVGPYGPLAPSLVEAAGAALVGSMKKGPFENANLLPADLRKRKRSVGFSIAWHTVAVGVLLFLSVLFFAHLYVSQAEQISDAEQRLAEYPAEAQMTVPQLQARIDSLRQRQAQMAGTMAALDSLVVGNDAWTQTLLTSTRAASGTGGIWIEDLEPVGAELQITGFATSRDRVVGMAQRLAGTIDEMTYKDVRDYPVYEYRITFPMEGGLPQITRVLREQAGESLPVVPIDPADAALDAALGTEAPGLSD